MNSSSAVSHCTLLLNLFGWSIWFSYSLLSGRGESSIHPLVSESCHIFNVCVSLFFCIKIGQIGPCKPRGIQVNEPLMLNSGMVLPEWKWGHSWHQGLLWGLVCGLVILLWDCVVAGEFLFQVGVLAVIPVLAYRQWLCIRDHLPGWVAGPWLGAEEVLTGSCRW